MQFPLYCYILSMYHKCIESRNISIKATAENLKKRFSAVALYLRLLCVLNTVDMADEINKLIAVTPLVVVPGNQLNEGVV